MSITILTYILGFFIAILLGWITYLHIRMKRLFMGTKAKDLEEVMYTLGKHTENLEITQKEINRHLEHLDNKMKKTIRGVETIRFNPFPDHGSNQSFAISFINDEGDGVVMSSIYARDRMSIFAKPIKAGKSDYELSEEEKEVLTKTK
ncbi:MAG: hypothetical protein RL687_183 [Candidatus Parcubacteria bacterium]